MPDSERTFYLPNSLVCTAHEIPRNRRRPLPVDSVLSDELRSLQEEVAVAHRQRHMPAPSSPAAERISAGGMPTADGSVKVASAAPDEAAEERALRDQLDEFVDQVTQFFEDAEKNIAAHPAESVIGALLLGILIGRLLGRG